MVISQIAGIATAFGIGELSGAGFGPNYTILMKLGYEFFAPRILEEMEKNPNVFFQDTLWFQKFQKQIKLYSDSVMTQTLDQLLDIPQKTIDAIESKFGKGGTDSNIFSENLIGNVQGGLDIVEAVTKAISKISFNFNILPQAFGATPSAGGTSLNTLPTVGIPTQFTQPTGTIGPVQEFKTQKQIFNSTNDYNTYRQRGGLLSKKLFENAKNPRAQQLAAGVLHLEPTKQLVVGATSTRRRTQSSDKQLKSLIQQIKNIANRLKAAVAQNNKTLINSLKKLLLFKQQSLIKHQNTYK